MSDKNFARTPVTAALRADYDLLYTLVGVASLDWIVIRSNPNCEKRAQASVASNGVVAWCPMRSSVGRRGRTKKEFDTSRPIYTGYVFAALDRSAHQGVDKVVGCDGVERVLSFSEDRRPHVVPAKKMRAIIEQAWEAQTRQNWKPPQQLDVGAPFTLLMNGFVDVTAGEVTAYDAAKGKVTGELHMFGRKVPVRTSVDKIKTVTE
ncbi:MAG: hypothetical protein JJ902_23400 [Roseibium sp.]|nr:hypothetical protein [Roseibium sp.]